MQLLNTNSTSYTKIDKLGEGSFGEVFLAKNIKNDQLVVCKEMRLNGLDEPTIMQLFTEVKVLQAIKHPNIIEMKDSYRTKSNKLVLILEYASNGDLDNYIKDRQESPIDQRQIEIWILQLCLALKHSHDHKIIHRDLKTSNIFLDEFNNLKLGDFGLAKNLINSTQNCKGFAGTPLYLSPESITKGTTSYKSDIWALGIILYELCSLKNPFFCTSYPMLMKKICNDIILPIPDIYSTELNTFILSLLERDETKRPSITQILESDFIRSLLINNKDEFKKLVSQTTLSNIDINDDSLKKDFACMKVYRFSEYKDPSKMILKIENIVKKNEKVSRFKNKNNELILSDDDEEESEVEESGIFNDTPMINGIQNMDIDIQNDSYEEDEEDRNRVTNNLFLSDDEQEEQQNNSLLSGKEEDIFMNSKFNDSFGKEDKKASFYNSVIDSFFRNRPEEQHNEPAFDETMKGHKPTVSTQMDNSGALDREEQQEMPSKFKNTANLLSSDEEEDFNCNSDNISYNYSNSKRMDSETNSNNFGSFLGNSRKNSNIQSTHKKSGISNQVITKKNSYFKQLCHKASLIDKPQPNKFKIKKKVKTKTKLKHGSVESKKKKTTIQRLQSTNREGTNTKMNFKNISINKLNKEKFKLKLKSHNNIMNDKMKLIKVNLNSFGDFTCQNTLVPKNCLKTNTVTSFKELSKVYRVNERISSITSNVSKISKTSSKMVRNTSITSKSGQLDEYGFFSVKKKKNISNNQSYNKNPLHHKNLNKINRKSKVSQVQIKKNYFIKQYGNKFNFIYSYIKKFLIAHGLKEVERKLHNKKEVITQLKHFVGKNWEYFQNKNNLIDLVRLSIMEIKSDLL